MLGDGDAVTQLSMSSAYLQRVLSVSADTGADSDFRSRTTAGEATSRTGIRNPASGPASAVDLHSDRPAHGSSPALLLNGFEKLRRQR